MHVAGTARERVRGGWSLVGWRLVGRRRWWWRRGERPAASLREREREGGRDGGKSREETEGRAEDGRDLTTALAAVTSATAAWLPE
ncbi:hypothetical protein NL676_007381 [Syzygium grande]|nr:hypothetical protein NL676_007381 [Syzygium grande]